MEKTIANSKLNKDNNKKEPEYKKIPIYVLKALENTHPSKLSRAAAIKAHIAQNINVNDLAAKGKSRLNSIFIRNWSYDEDSESVVISDSFTSPENAGSESNGITGIDVDASLGF